MGTVSKTDLISVVAETTGLSKALAANAISTFLGGVTAAALAGDKVILQSFGTFEMKTRAARTARNPATGVPVEVPEQTRLTFKASKAKA